MYIYIYMFIYSYIYLLLRKHVLDWDICYDAEKNYPVHLNEMFSKQVNHICISSFILLLNRGSNQNGMNFSKEHL